MEDCFHRKHINNKVVLLQKVIGTHVYSMKLSEKRDQGVKQKRKEGRTEERKINIEKSTKRKTKIRVRGRRGQNIKSKKKKRKMFKLMKRTC